MTVVTVVDEVAADSALAATDGNLAAADGSLAAADGSLAALDADRAAADESRQTFVLRRGALAPRVARGRVRAACHRAETPSTLSDNAALVAGELVTTSLRQGIGAVQVKVHADSGSVVIRVYGQPGEKSGGGSPGALRRWDVVRRLSRSYGYRSYEGGREVWAVLGSG